jgi:hypothetical protein
VTLVRAIVRVRILEIVGAELEQILISIKVYILRAVAVRVLQSGDIKVTLPNQQIKNQVIT